MAVSKPGDTKQAVSNGTQEEPETHIHPTNPVQPSKGTLPVPQVNKPAQEQITPTKQAVSPKVEDITEQWQHTGEWTYIGEGEWVQLEESANLQAHTAQELNREPEWVHKWRTTVDEDIQLHEKVLKGGYPNRWGAKIELKHKWNLQLMEDLLRDYEDNEVVEWMRYGWPSGRLPTLGEPEHSTKKPQRGH